MRLGAIDAAEEIPRVGNTTVRRVPEGVHLAYPGVARFLVREGREVVVAPEHGADERDLRLSLLGPVLAVLLHSPSNKVMLPACAAIGRTPSDGSGVTRAAA